MPSCRQITLSLLALLLSATAPVAGGGKPPAEKSDAAHGAVGAGAPPPREWKMDPPLEGQFDLTLLRNRERVTKFRHDIEGIRQTIPRPDRPRELSMSISLEFGRESGMAEIEDLDPILRLEIRRIVERYSFRDLMHPDGKRRLKEDIRAEANRQLRTARVRAVYFTQFEIYIKPIASPVA